MSGISSDENTVGLTDTELRASPIQVRPGAGTVTHISGTAGSTSSTALASNANRVYLMIQNHSTRTMWFRLDGTAAATKPSIKLLPNTVFTMESGFISTQAVTVIREGNTDVDFTIIEGT